MTTPRSGGRDPKTRFVRFKEILIVDQDEAWALVMRDAVAGGGFCVVVVTVVEEALRKIREKACDLVLLSCLLGEESSQALLQEVERLAAAPPVVLVGLRDGDARWEAWKSKSFVTVIRQPFKSREVLNAARTLLGQSWEDPPSASES